MMYYVNWVLTTAQLELLAADVSVVDYDYGDKKRKKSKKGEFDDTPASVSSIDDANRRWNENHSGDGGWMDISDVLGGMEQGVGVKLND